MTIGLGTDIVEIVRIKKAVEKGGEAFLERSILRRKYLLMQNATSRATPTLPDAGRRKRLFPRLSDAGSAKIALCLK